MKRVQNAGFWRVAVMATLLLLMAGGCTASPSPAAAVPLTEDELAYFNGDEFFNGCVDASRVVTVNIRNQFLNALYDAPEDIDLYALFYDGSGSDADEDIGAEEMAAVLEAMGAAGEPELDCTKISAASMDAVLQTNAGIALADTKGVGLENFTYLESYDAYYIFHGDSSIRAEVSFTGGEREGDTLRLFYKDEFMADGYKVLTLTAQDGGYRFAANQLDTFCATEA